MKAKKVFAEQMMKDLGELRLTKKELVDNARVMAHESEDFANMVFEVGAKAIFKEYKKLRRKEKYSNGDHFEPLSDIEETISFMTGVMRKAQYSERKIQHFVYEFYEQFNVPEDRRFLLKHVGVVTSCNIISDCGHWVIEGDDEREYSVYASDIRGDKTLQIGEVVSFIPDGTTAKYIENAEHCDKDDEDSVPLEYSPATMEDISKLRGMVLYLAGPADPAKIGKGTVFVYKESYEDGVNDLVETMVSVMRAQGSDEREIKNCVISLYDQFDIPEEEREIRHTGVVRWQNQSHERGFIKDDNGDIVRFYKNDIAGDNDTLLKKGEIVSFITDGKLAWNVKNYRHYVPDDMEPEDEEGEW